MTTGVKSSVGSWNPGSGSKNVPISLPPTYAVGDPTLVLFGTNGNNGTAIGLDASMTNWTVLASGIDGTSTWMLIKRNGGRQSSDGTSTTIVLSYGEGVGYLAFGLDGTVYDPDEFTLGSINTRSTSKTTNTAPAVTNNGAGILVVSSERASSHTGAPDAPTVSPTTTLGGWSASSAASTPSEYVGFYDATGADRTITYSTASANGAALQIALTAVTPPIPETNTLRGYIHSGSEIAGATLRGYMSGGVEQAAPSIQ